MKTHQITIAIVDDHWGIRDSYGNALRRIKYIDTVETFATAKEMLTKMRKNPYDLVLLDISLKDEDGLDICKEIKNQYKNVKVLIFSTYDSGFYIFNAYQNNADGYICKDGDVEELNMAIDKIILQNERYFNAKSVETIFRMQETNKNRQNNNEDELSDREIEVMLLFCLGKSDKEIGVIFDRSEATISKHRHNILKKIGGHKSIEILNYAIKNGLYIPAQKEEKNNLKHQVVKAYKLLFPIKPKKLRSYSTT